MRRARVGVADIRENSAREVAEKYGVDWFIDYKRLLEEKTGLCDSGGSHKTPL